MAKKERFEKIYSQGTVDVMQIWRDTETGVNYVFHKQGYAGGMTPLLDKDGKSVVTLSEKHKRQGKPRRFPLPFSIYCNLYIN